MATGTKANFIIYNEEYQGGQIEAIAQNLSIFNEASRGALRMETVWTKGEFTKESFFPLVTGLVNRRDNTDTTTGVADTPLTQAELVDVKLERRLGPVGQTLDAWKKLGKNPEEMSFNLGKMFGQAKLQSAINTTITAAAAGLANASSGALVYNGTSDSTATMTADKMVAGMAKMGDAAQNIVAFVMHSKPFYDLVKGQVSGSNDIVANTTIYGGSPGTLGKPVIVIDSSSLYSTIGSGSAAYTRYTTLGLTAGAGWCNESEPETVVSETVTGFPSLIYRVQGEYSMNLGLKGMAYLVGSGANPTDGTIGTGTNWTMKAASIKDLGGVVIYSK